MKPAAPKVARTVVDKIAQRMSYIMLSVLGFIPRQLFVCKSDLILEERAAVKSKNGDFTAKGMPLLAPLLRRNRLLA